MSHGLFFKQRNHNEYFSLMCNWPLIFPYTASFTEYHLDHHRQLGTHGIDTDIPTEWEAKTFNTSFMKFLWVLFQPLFYALRPVIVNPKPLKLTNLINIISQGLFTYILYHFAGITSIWYLFLSTWLGLGIHPCGGHFIAEHVQGISTSISGDDNSSQSETFSYRGPLNIVSFNVGYHVAHHDFACVSGFRLPYLEKKAPEFYATLPTCKSWVMATWTFILNNSINLFARVKLMPVE